jgi:hypothetical protein
LANNHSSKTQTLNQSVKTLTPFQSKDAQTMEEYMLQELNISKMHSIIGGETYCGTIPFTTTQVCVDVPNKATITIGQDGLKTNDTITVRVNGGSDVKYGSKFVPKRTSNQTKPERIGGR